MVQSTNEFSSTFIQPQYNTLIPGKASIAEQSGGTVDGSQLFSQKKGGDFVSPMVTEELAIRRSGKKPSKEFMEEKKRL